ncbi:MAG: hypothetical protein J1E34_08560 [Oscillospiraceae bacterium]|nr:hypothetical protein [Oscillospiraceae bacterium]
MKKFLSVILAAVMVFTVMLPVFAEDKENFTAVFTGASSDLMTTSPSGEDIGEAYCFVKSENGKMLFVEDENGKYYLATNGGYYTKEELIEGSIEAGEKTYSPDIFVPGESYPLTKGETFSFVVKTNEAYNAATVVVYINGVAATKNAVGEYAVLVDRSFSIYVNESALQRNQFNVVLKSGEGYRVKSLQNENYKAVYYGDDFSFRVKILNNYSDSNLAVRVTRGTSGLEEFLGDAADLFEQIIGNSEILTSDGMDSEGYRTYTIKDITTDCYVSVSGVKQAKTANVMNIIKRLLKMILDAFGIDTSFLGIDIIDFNYYTVNIDDSGLGDADISYMILTGANDEFIMDQFNVMGGDSVTIRFVTYDVSLVRLSDIYGPMADAPAGYNDQKLKLSWTPGNADGFYKNVWTAQINRSTGKTYYTTTFVIDNIKANTGVTIAVEP